VVGVQNSRSFLTTNRQYFRSVRAVVGWLFLLLGNLILACGNTGTPRATLQVLQPTATSTSRSVSITPTSVLPSGAQTTLTTDPAIIALLDQVQSDRLMVVVGSLADMGSRHVASKPSGAIAGIDKARDWLVAQFNAIRADYPYQPISVWTQPVPFTWNNVNIAPENVVAVFQGTDVGAGVIVVGAHYDSISRDYYNGQAYAPGGNDDASGIAAMLEIARILAPRSHHATILFVAFAAEETGRQGSKAFVQAYLQAQNPPIALRGMINLDMIGSEMGPNGEIDRENIRLFSAEPNNSPSRQFARQLALIADTYLSEIKIVLQSAEDRAGRWGDHQSFSAAGYPSVRFIQSLEDLSRQHSPTDTIDNVQPGYLMRTTRAALVATAILADGPMPPTELILQASVSDPRLLTLSWTPVPNAARYLIALRHESSLPYDQIFTIDAAPGPELTWNLFDQYATVAIAAINGSGRMGPLSPEAPIAALLRK
jgi:hypothetical protein